MNKFTLILHNKGWTVKAAIARWGIDYSTYNRRCNNERMFQQLEDMCNGLENKVHQDFAKWHYADMKKAIEISCGFGEGMGEVFKRGVVKND